MATDKDKKNSDSQDQNDSKTAQTEKEVSAEASKDAGENALAAKPTGEGNFDGEVRDGYAWSKRDHDWREWRGVDHTKGAAAAQGAQGHPMPPGHEHVGDGSPQKPHNVQPVQRWS